MNPNYPVPPGAGGPPVYLPPTPQPPQPPGWPPPERTRHGGLAISGFVVALVGITIAWVPVLGFVGAIGGMLGVIALFGANKGGERRKIGLAIAAVVIGAFDAVAAAFWLFVYGALSTMSCPHVYAHDGTDYRLDADPLSGSLFAAAESDDMDRLEHAAPTDGAYRIRVADDLQERDYIDRVTLKVVDHPGDVEVLPTQGGELATVRLAEGPKRATDGKARDVLELVLTDDDRSFISRAEDFTPDGAEEPRERLTMDFQRPAGDRFVLVLRCRNSAFAVEAFSRYLAEMGPGLGPLLRSAQDSSSYPYKQRVADEMQRLGLPLAVEVWDGRGWTPAGELHPIGPAVLREQALTLALPPAAGDTVRVQLSMSPLMWEVDRVRLGVGGAPEPGLELLPRGARDGSGNAPAALVASSDVQRLMLRPGEGVELAYDAPPGPAPGLRRTVLVSIRGYYEVDIGGRGWMDPFAILAHRSGSTSLPRYAVELAQQRQLRR